MATTSVVPPAPRPSVVPPAPKPPLRRATYVNVDKLVRSQYEINLELLTDELSKLKVASAKEEEKENDATAGDAKEGKGSTPVEGAGTSASSEPTKPNAWSGTNLSVLPGGPLRAPLPGKYHQSRLQPPRDGFNLCLLVGKVETVVDKFRVDGSRVLVAEVEVGDETGSISLRARDEQIDKLREVSEAGGAIVLRNCTMELYQGKHLRLAVSKWGKMTAYPDGIASTPNPPSSMNQELNFSLVDLNIVATTKMPNDPAFPMPVATVHHKPQKQHPNAPKHFDGGTPRSRGRGRGRGHFAHEKKDWQYHRQHQQHQQGRPRSGSHMSGGGGPGPSQYVLQHQQSGGSTSPPQNFAVPGMHYQQYGDASSVYSYPSQQQDQQGGSPHRQFLPNDHYRRQNHILYQQYEMQQRHAHQMQLLQQHQESQMALLHEQQRQQQIHSALIPDINRAESHDSPGQPGQDYPPIQGMGPPSLQLGSGTFPPTPTMQPNPSPTQPMPPPHQSHPAMSSEYPYGSALMQSPPMGTAFQGVQGGDGQPQPPRGSMTGVPTYATIISPPMSPTHTSHPAPQYPDGRLDGQYKAETKE